jgi:uncharacterized protein YidB (DUF937 family)
MAKGSPSLIALLGLLAVAGYQNRDKLGGMLNNRSGLDPMRQPSGGLGQDASQGGMMDSLHSMFGQSGGGNLLGGLSELFDRFANPVQRAKVDSWVKRGPNAPLSSTELEEALDEETLAELGAKTGLSREELLSRLSTTLPDAVDQVTPDGQFPPVSMTEPRSV